MRKSVRLLVFLLTLIALPAASSAQLTIAGRVTDEGGRGLAGAQVSDRRHDHRYSGRNRRCLPTGGAVAKTRHGSSRPVARIQADAAVADSDNRRNDAGFPPHSRRAATR